MRQQNAFQAVGGEGPFQAKQAEEGGQPALPTVDAQNPEHRHQYREDERHRAQPQQGKSAGETSAIERAREENGRDRREQCGEKRLPEGETNDVPEIAVVPEGEQIALWRVKPQRKECPQADDHHQYGGEQPGN